MSGTLWFCECGAKYELPDAALGRKVRCNHCGAVRPDVVKIVVQAGKDYVDAIKAKLPNGVELVELLQGKAIGQRLQWLTNQNAGTKAADTASPAQEELPDDKKPSAADTESVPEGGMSVDEFADIFANPEQAPAPKKGKKVPAGPQPKARKPRLLRKDPKMKTKRQFLVAAGDDWPEDYGRGFDVPIQTICDIISESREWDLPIDWREASQQQPHGIRLLCKCLESIDSSCDIYQIFDVIEGCSVTHKRWGGDSPGRSGVWVEIHAEEGKLAPARIVVRKLATVLRRYWQSSGNAAKADAYMAALRAEQEASAKERKDKEHPKRLEWEAEQ
jgi:hypothetical protein